MQITEMLDSDWESFKNFAKKNLTSSFVANRTFNEFWFRRKDGTWSIQLAKKNDGTISAINMLIETYGKICKKVSPFTWTSAAYADSEGRKEGIIGLMLFNLHRNLPFIGSACANENSLPINEKLGISIPNFKMRRFIYVHSFKSLKIVKSQYESTVKKHIKFVKYNLDRSIIKKWSKSIPQDINKLWLVFSKKLECCIQKNFTYLVLRYVKSPFQNYDILTFRDKKNNLLGVSIIRFQKTPRGCCSRIVDFMSIPNFEFKIWRETLKECEKKNVLFTDFIVMGTFQDQHLLKAGFQLASVINRFDEIPNLLSPIEHRNWSYTFHISGYLPKKLKGWKYRNKIWFTKGDGDRDWPTPYDIKQNI